MVTWVFYFCLGLGIGGAAGFYFARLDDLNKKKRQELEEKLAAAEAQYLDYKKEVTSHFVDTATLINNMTDSYQAVHEHLTKGAQILCSNELEVNRIEVKPVKTPLIQTPGTTNTASSVEQIPATVQSSQQSDIDAANTNPQQSPATQATEHAVANNDTGGKQNSPAETSTGAEPQDPAQTEAVQTQPRDSETGTQQSATEDTREKIKLEKNERKPAPQTAAVVTPPIVESMAVVDETDTLETTQSQEEPTAIIPDRIIH